jgi:serine/threonine-protein kinase HipA
MVAENAYARVETALVHLWGDLVGAVAWDPDRALATFEFDRDFLDRDRDVAPLKMPLATARRGDARFSFRNLPRETFRGLPGLLADALPDDFGNSIINTWLARQGRTPESFSPVERLCYTGSRAMGALEFQPAVQEAFAESVPVEVAELVRLAQAVADQRSGLTGDLEDDTTDALLDIIRVGTSAGGGRPKAVIAWNEATGEVRSGQVTAPVGFTHWLLKFDGVRDHQLGEPAGYGRIEYAYFLMAQACGIEMMPCRLLHEGDRAHFMTRRFDRPGDNRKLHLQSLCAMAHFDFNEPAMWSYEQAFQVMRELRLPYGDAEQMFRRLVFNVVARNQDDHTKNIAFLMDEGGVWRLSPAFDVIYAYNPSGAWTAKHQMSINGKREGITAQDLLAVADEMNIRKARDMIGDVLGAVARWRECADVAEVPPETAARIETAFRRFG